MKKMEVINRVTEIKADMSRNIKELRSLVERAPLTFDLSACEEFFFAPIEECIQKTNSLNMDINDIITALDYAEPDEDMEDGDW